MNKTKEVQHFREEIRAALSGLNQELKEIISKYKPIIPLEKILVTVEADGTDRLSSATSFIVDEEKITNEDAEVFSQLEDEDDEEFLSTEEIEFMQAQVAEIEAKPIRDSVALSALAHRKSQSTAVLFEAHKTLQ